MKALNQTLALLDEARARCGGRALVSWSGGKDSAVILDIAKRAFEHVEAFFLYFVPGLRCVDDEIQRAQDRYKVKIHQYPHWGLLKTLNMRRFMFPPSAHELAEPYPSWGRNEAYALAIADTGIPLILTGARGADSAWRRRMVKTWGSRTEVVYPIVGWQKPDVLAYLRLHNIPRPDSSGRSATGIGLSTPSLLWLHDKYPEDYERVCRIFPLARAIVARRKYHGITG